MTVVALALLAAGCPSEEAHTRLVPDNPFAEPAKAQIETWTTHAQKSLVTAGRADTVGRQLIKANPQLGIVDPKLGTRPRFETVGDSRLLLCHQGMDAVIISEGLVNQCKTDDELAAVLCAELGKMVAAREALAGPHGLDAESAMDLRVGSDNAGSFGPADQVYRAEQARYQEERRQRAQHARPPDAQALARLYLVKAGHPAAALEAVAPLLQSAGDNNSLAKQLASPPPSGH
jgi:hypothetical protein